LEFNSLRKTAPVNLPEIKKEGMVNEDNLSAGFAKDSSIRSSMVPNLRASPGQVATHDGCLP
jgi:hypothetical protein